MMINDENKERAWGGARKLTKDNKVKEGESDTPKKREIEKVTKITSYFWVQYCWFALRLGLLRIR